MRQSQPQEHSPPLPEAETAAFTAGIDYSTDDFSAIADNIRDAINDVVSNETADIDSGAGTDKSGSDIDFDAFAGFDDGFDDFGDISDEGGNEEQAQAATEENAAADEPSEELPVRKVDGFNIDFSAFEDPEEPEKKEKPFISKGKRKGKRRK